MKKNDKSIKAQLDKIAFEEKIINKIGKFVTTKRGKQFVSMLHRMPLKDLCDRYKCKFMLIYDSNTKNMNVIKASIQKYYIPDESPKVAAKEKPTIVKCKSYLNRDDLKEISARNKPKKFGFAALMHAYEEHKMDKFKNKNPGPTERDLIQDLFPEELKLTYNTQLWLYREYVRNFLCRKYAGQNIRERYYRLFLVYNNNINNSLYEKEGDPIIVGYPFAECTQYTNIEKIKDILRQRAKMIAQRDKTCIEVKLYNKYGKFLASVKT